MDVFSAPDFDDHEEVHFFADAGAGLRAIIAIHHGGPGLAGGGCRMWPYQSDEAALGDALRLSKGMTYKWALANIPMGGGKTVVIGDPERDKSRALLLALARCLNSFGGRYVTGPDVGTNEADFAVMHEATEYVAGLPDKSGDPSPATAEGVHLGIRAAVAHRLGRDDLTGIRVAVQGLGQVGFALCRRLAGDGASLLVSDVRPGLVARAERELGAAAADADRIHALDVDVFAPCALGAVINDRTVPEIKAAIVAGCANNQLAEDRHGPALAARGILYAPDYVINAGGAISASSEITGQSRDAVRAAVIAIPDTLKEIFARAERDGVPTSVAADRIAEERIGRRRGAGLARDREEHA